MKEGDLDWIESQFEQPDQICGIPRDMCDELLMQGIKPWDDTEPIYAALSHLYDFDYDSEYEYDEYDQGWEEKRCYECDLEKSDDVELRLCSGCRVVRYCSRHCQKISWKFEHRLECDVLCEDSV